MPAEQISFRGHVPTAGFRLLQARRRDLTGDKGPETFVVPAGTEEAAPAGQAYELQSLDVVLHRVFAETSPNAEGVLDFAGKYGLLGVGVDLQPEPGAKTPPLTRGELLAEWLEQISLMLQLVTLWDLCQAGDTTRLARHLHWEEAEQPSARVVFRSHVDGDGGDIGPSVLGHHKTREVLLLADLPAGLQGRIEPGDVVLPALVLVQRRLDEQVRLQERGVTPSVMWDGTQERPVVRFAASCLAGALWLQFADAVTHGRSYARCVQCNKWFERAPELARSHKRFCTDACRVRAYRHRQELARRLYHEGQTFEQVAAELESTVKTVRRWITGQ